MLLGHQGNVCALDVWQNEKADGVWLVSGSWDASACVWDVERGEQISTLEGHEASVWAVLAYGEDRIITGVYQRWKSELTMLTRNSIRMRRQVHSNIHKKWQADQEIQRWR